jgi:hypothetical protein
MVECGIAQIVLADQGFQGEQCGRDLIEMTVFGCDMQWGVARSVALGQSLGSELSVRQYTLAGGCMQI